MLWVGCLHSISWRLVCLMFVFSARTQVPKNWDLIALAHSIHSTWLVLWSAHGRCNKHCWVNELTYCVSVLGLPSQSIQTRWLKTEICILSETRKLKPRCQQGLTSSEVCRRILPHLFLVSGVCWQFLAFLGFKLHHSLLHYATFLSFGVSAVSLYSNSALLIRIP